MSVRISPLKIGDSQFGPDQLSHFQKITVPRNAEQESDRVTDVAHDQLNRERGFGDVQVSSPPGE